jgi:hypothetical protein
MLTSNIPGDASVFNGRALAMELLAGLLLNHGQHFQRFPSLMLVVKNELGNCLLANSKSSAPALQRLTCHIFVLVLKTFREELKSKVCHFFLSALSLPHSQTIMRCVDKMSQEHVFCHRDAASIGSVSCSKHWKRRWSLRLDISFWFVHMWHSVQVAYLFQHTILRGLEPASGDGKDVALDYRLVVFACLDPICADGQLLMDLFVNMDCDPDRTDTVLLERLFKLLCGCIVNPDALGDPLSANGQLQQQHRNMLRYAALRCLNQALHSLFDWQQEMSSACPACDGFPAGLSVQSIIDLALLTR